MATPTKVTKRLYRLSKVKTTYFSSDVTSFMMAGLLAQTYFDGIKAALDTIDSDDLNAYFYGLIGDEIKNPIRQVPEINALLLRINQSQQRLSNLVQKGGFTRLTGNLAIKIKMDIAKLLAKIAFDVQDGFDKAKEDPHPGTEYSVFATAHLLSIFNKGSYVFLNDCIRRSGFVYSDAYSGGGTSVALSYCASVLALNEVVNTGNIIEISDLQLAGLIDDDEWEILFSQVISSMTEWTQTGKILVP